jgi:hypothetical protein
MVRRPEGTKFQHVDRKTRDRSHRGDANIVRATFPLFPSSHVIHFILYSGAWKSAQFKKYNFESEGIYPNGGALHPLLKVREEMCNIFLEMGLVATRSSAYSPSDFVISHRQLC